MEPLPIANAANGEPPPRLTPRAEKLLNRGSVRDHWKLVAVRREDYRLFYKMLPGLVARWRPRLHNISFRVARCFGKACGKHVGKRDGPSSYYGIHAFSAHVVKHVLYSVASDFLKEKVGG